MKHYVFCEGTIIQQFVKYLGYIGYLGFGEIFEFDDLVPDRIC